MGLLEEARKKREAAAAAKAAPAPVVSAPKPAKLKVSAPKVNVLLSKPIMQVKSAKVEKIKPILSKSKPAIQKTIMPTPSSIPFPEEPLLQQSDLDELEKEMETQEIPLPEPPQPIEDAESKKHFDLFSFLKKKDKAVSETKEAPAETKSSAENAFAPPAGFSPSLPEISVETHEDASNGIELPTPIAKPGKKLFSFIPKLPRPSISAAEDNATDDLFSVPDEKKEENSKKENFLKWLVSGGKKKKEESLDLLSENELPEDEFAMPEPPKLDESEFNIPEAPSFEKESSSPSFAEISQPVQSAATELPSIESNTLAGDEFIDSLLKSSSPSFSSSSPSPSSSPVQNAPKMLPPVPSQKVTPVLEQTSKSMLPETLADFEKPREIMEKVESQQERKPSKSVQKLMDKRKQLQDEVVSLKKQIEGMHNEMDSLTLEMEEKRKMMEENSRQLDEKEAAVTEKIKSAEEKIKQLESLKGHIEGVRDDVKQKSEHIEKTKVLATQVYADRQAVEQRHSQVSEKEKAVSAKESQLKQLESQLREKEASLQQKEQELSAKESQLKELEASVNNTNSELKSREDTLTASESQLKELEESINNKESALKAREDKLHSSESQLREKEKKLTTEYKGLEDDEFKKYMEEILKEISGQSIKVSQAGDAFSDLANPELVEYITKHLAKGFRQERIMNALRGAGWSDDEIKISMNEALFSSGMVSSRKQLPPVVSASSPSNPARLKGMGQLMSDARNFLAQKKIPQAQQALLDAKRLYDTLRLDENKKQMLKFELQDLKTDIDLALLS